MSETPELAPCPFCGEMPLDDDGYAMCMTDGCALDQVHVERRAWNHRASPAGGDDADLVEPMEETLKRSSDNMLEVLVARGVIHFSRLEGRHRIEVRADGSWHMKHPLSCELDRCPVDALMRGGVGPDVAGEYVFVNGGFTVARLTTEEQR